MRIHGNYDHSGTGHAERVKERLSYNILVVDDEKELADVIELYLMGDGYTVHKCYTGREALECIAHTDLDLAILDVMLPGINSIRFCLITSWR